MGIISNLVINENDVYDSTVLNGTGREIKILAEGDYGYDSEKRHFAIVRTRLGHPCAYIEVKPDDHALKEASDYNDDVNDDITCDCFDVFVHGGATYCGEAYWDKSDKRMYLGWDYAHYGDYTPTIPWDSGKKWTMLEIFADIVEAYAGIREQNEEHWEEDVALPEERDGT